VAVDAEDENRRELMRVFRKDAVKASATLPMAADTNDFALFAITAHAMKSAAANIGEDRLMGLARDLENAGKAFDASYIHHHLQEYLDALQPFTIIPADADLRSELPESKPLMGGINVAFVQGTADPDALLGIALLKEKLLVIMNACEDYDIETAETALRSLMAGKWPEITAKLLEQISDSLLHSDFDEAVKLAGSAI